MRVVTRRSLVVLALCGAATLSAQASGAGTIRGRVTLAGDTAVVPGVDVEIVGTTLRFATDRNGRYEFLAVPSGDVVVRVRRPGWAPSYRRVKLEPDHWLEVDLTLERLPTALSEVRINGKMLKVPARYEDVYWRGSRGFGSFFSRQDIERLHPYDVVSLLQWVPGVMPRKNGVRFARCDGWGAKVQVYVDGVRMSKPGFSIGNGDSGDLVSDALHGVPISAIEAVEVYRGVAQIPAEFLDDACAVVAIWTKSY